MNKKVFYFLPVLLSLLISFNLFAAPSGPDISYAFKDAARSASPSVVSIAIYKTDNGTLVQRGFGSGTIITRDGYVVTNYHVIASGDRLQIITGDKKRYEISPFNDGSLYRADPKTDIALIRIAAPENKAFPAIAFSDSASLEAGEWVIAIGSPYGLTHTITAGIVSSTGRDSVGFTDIEDFIQTDTAINPGNSGGPLVNLKGHLVGINTAIRSTTGTWEGISFAIPSNTVRHVCDELLRYGRVRRGWIGFIAREELSSTGGTTVSVISVVKGSPAERYGIERGDIILRVDGAPIYRLGQLVKITGNRPLGRPLELIVERKGREKAITLPFIEKNSAKDLDRVLYTLYLSLGVDLGLENSGGRAVVLQVTPKGYARGFRRGDVIESLDGRQVSSFHATIRILKDHKPASILVERQGSRILIPVRD